MSATLQKSCAKSARTMRNRLRGFLPIYKEAGVHWLDAMDMLRISLEFDTGIRFNSVNIISNCFPYLHKSAEAVAYGQQVHDLPLLKHSDSVYTCKARFGELRKNHHQDGILIDTRKFEHITKDQLTEALKSFEASDTQMKLWKEYRTRTVLHELQAIKAEDKLEAPPKRSLYFEGRSARQVKFHSAELVTFEPPDFTFKLHCSSLFCVHRMLADIGSNLSTYAHFTSLVKETEGPVSTEDSLKSYQWHYDEVTKHFKTVYKTYQLHVEKIKQDLKESTSRHSRHRNPWL